MRSRLFSFPVNYHVACLFFFKAPTCQMLVWLLVLHEKIRLPTWFMRVRFGSHSLCQTVLVWYRNNLVLLSDKRSGVLLSTTGGRLPNRTRAGLCFKLLCVSPSDNPMCVMHHLLPWDSVGHTAHIFSAKGWERNDYENDYLFLLIILFQLVFQ